MSAALKLQPQQHSLYIQKSAAEYNAELAQYTSLAWSIAYTALWNAAEFSQQETDAAKQYIQQLLQQAASHKKAYTQLVQRVLLARQYIQTHPGAYAPLPTQWFNAQNSNGFAGTQKWFQTVEQTRQSLPLYKQSLKAFAEAVQETLQSNKPADFHYWRSYFIQQNAQGLLNLYLSTLANYTLGNATTTTHK